MILPPVDPDIPFSDDDDFEGSAPNCERCLIPMELKDSHWFCPECGTAKLA